MKSSLRESSPKQRSLTLDFDGGVQIYRNAELGMDIPVNVSPSGISDARRKHLAAALRREGFDVAKAGTRTIHVGRTDAFDAFGNFAGLAEGIGTGDAFVFLDDSASDAELLAVIRHEAGHILGTLDHGGAGLARYAWTHVYEDWEFQSRGLWGENAYEGRIGAEYLYSKTTITVTNEALQALEYVDNITLEARDGGIEYYYVYDNECKLYSAELNGYYMHRYDTTYTELEEHDTYFYQASGLQAGGTINILGGIADNCTAKNIEVRGIAAGWDLKTIRTEYGWRHKNYNYHWVGGTANGCKATNKITVYGRAVARNCEARYITVGGASENHGEDEGYQYVNGRVENCRASYLTVETGGIARDVMVSGIAYIGINATTPEEAKQADQVIAQNGTAKLINFYDNGKFGDIHAYRGAEVRNVYTAGCIHATEGASLGGSLTCGSVNLQGVVPESTITIKVDLRDCARANYTERFYDDNDRLVKAIDYFANYTTKTYTYQYDLNGVTTSATVTNGTFDNADGRFDMRDWVYNFSVYLGTVDALALPYITVDFGGTESEFGGGSVSFYYPSTTREIQFVMNSDKRKWEEVWDNTWSTGEFEYQGYMIYDPTLHGEAAEVLWLEYGDDEEVEYTVALPSNIMGGATEDVVIDGDAGGEAELKGTQLVVKGSVETGDVTVTAKDKENVLHECELELIVVPEELPLFGKEGAKVYSESLRKAQKTHTSSVSTTLKNIHIKSMFGAKFDVSDLAMNFTVDWTHRTAELKFQGKFEWTPIGAMAGSGKQVKVVIDLSGDNYISVTHNFNSKTFSWALVGELKVPDFNIGKFRFSNMALKVDTVSSSFYASAYIQLPGVKYSFGGDIGIVDGCIDSMHIGMDNLNLRLGTTGLRLQSINGGFSGLATELKINLEAGMGLSFGPKKHYTNLAWLDIGLDDGDFYLAELNLDAQISTDGRYTGTAAISAGAGFITGSGEFHFEEDYFSLNGDFFMIAKAISVVGSLTASKGNFTISGSGAMNLPNEKKWGPLAGTGMSVNVFADLGQEYLMAWSVINVFGNQFHVGIKSTFAGDVEMLGASDLLGGDDFGKKGLRSLKSAASADGTPLRGATPPSASQKYIVSDCGTSLFQVKLSVPDSTASASLSCNGVEYTQADIAAGLYGNMQIVGELTGGDCITIAVDNADLGEWTINAYGDSGATFSAFTLAGDLAAPQLDSVTLGEGARSATIRYTLGDCSALENAAVSIFRTTADDTDHHGLLLAQLAIEDATGIFEYEMPEDESHGGAYAFYIMVNSDGRTPVFSVTSDAVVFDDRDTYAPNDICSIDAVYLSTGSTLAWAEPYDDFGVVGYKVGYRASAEDEWIEADVAEPAFTFAAVPNGIYTYRVAAYDAAGNVAAWSVENSVLVNLGSNAAYKNSALAEDTALAEFEGAVNVDASAVKLTAAQNSLVSASTLGDAEIFGIVEETVIVGETKLFEGAKGRDLTVNGNLRVGVDTEEAGVVINPFVDEIPESVIDTTNLATAENVTVASGGTLTVGDQGRANGVTVAAGGALGLVGNAEFSDVTVGYGATLTIGGSGRYDLTDDIRIAGKLNAGRNVYGSGHKIVFEQYKQTAEFQDSLDDVAFVSDMDKLVGDVLEIEIDTEAYGRYKIADEAKYFDSAIKIVSHNDGSSAKVGLDEFTLVGNALCRLVYYDAKYGTYGLYLDVARSQIDAPTLSVENAENDYEDTISVSAAPADGTGEVTQYTFRYSTDADMSDAVIVTPKKNTFTIAKDELTANATYYMQVSVENTNGVRSLWSEAQSFTVIPKLDRPAAPLLSIDYADNRYWNYFTVSADYGWYSREKQYSFRYSLNADMSDAVVVTADEWDSYIDLAKDDFTANATYYIQGRAKSREDIWGDWGNTTSFTVVPVPDVPPAAPTNLTVTETDGGTVGYFRAEVDRDDANSDIRAYRFRYADNPEMENAVTVSTSSATYNYADIDRAKLEDGQNYYFQGAVKLGTEWSSWTDTVSVGNVLGWNYENITVDASGPYAGLALGGKRARNVTVVSGGYFYGGGRVDGITVDGGFFRDDGGLVTNAVVNGGSYWLYGGSVSDIQVNAGEFRLYDGSLDGAFIGADATAEIVGTYTPTVSGTILIQGQMNVAYYNPGVTTDASFVFDLGSHEAAKDRMFIDNAGLLLGERTFTVKLDDTPEAGNYRLSHTPNSGEYRAGLAAADGTDLGVMSLGGAAIAYNDLYYSLVGNDGSVYLHVSDSDAPAFLGKIKLAKGGTVYASEDNYYDLVVSASSECDSVLVEEGGRLYTVTIGDSGAVDVYGNLYGATVEAGGTLTLRTGCNLFSYPITVEAGGSVVIAGGSIDSSSSFRLTGGTITVSGELANYGGSSDYSHSWFYFDLDKLVSPMADAMISDYALLQASSPRFYATVAADQARGEYKLVGNAADFSGSVTVHYDGDNDWPAYLTVGEHTMINGVLYSLNCKEGVLTLKVGGGDSFDDAIDLGRDDGITGFYNASIDTVGEEDYYTFALSQKSVVNLSTNGWRGDTVMYLYDGKRNELADDDNGGRNNFSQITAELEAGTYYVKVGGNGTVEDYSLEFEIVDTAVFENAVNLGTDAAITGVSGASLAEYGEIDCYSFTLTRSANVTITTSGADSEGDTVMYLYNGNYTQIDWNDDCAPDNGNYYSQIRTNLDAGTYYVQVSAYSAVDDYSLTFKLGEVIPEPVINRQTADLNADGYADIVMTIAQTEHPADGSTGAWLIQGDHTAAWGDLSQRNPGWEIFGKGFTNPWKQAADVYVRSSDNVIGAWTTSLAGTVYGWETVGEFDADTQILGLGDFNGDGQSDLLLRNVNGAVGCYFTSGDTLGWNYFQSLGDEWKICAVGDLNGDGRDDVVLKHDAGFAGSWLTQSDYTMAWADLDTLAEGFTIVGCGDFDFDGTDDVLLQNGSYYGAWLVKNGNAAGWMGLGDLGSITVEEIADFDADGKADLRVRTEDGDLGAQLVQGEDTLEWHYYGSVGSEWSTSLAAI